PGTGVHKGQDGVEMLIPGTSTKPTRDSRITETSERAGLSVDARRPGACQVDIVDILQTLSALTNPGRRKELIKNIMSKETPAIDRRISILQTPIRNCLAPGIHGERLVHSMDIKRPQPSYRGIDKSTSERIVGPLPQRLSCHTGERDWGQSSYGILEVTWTTLGPNYAINGHNIISHDMQKPGKLHYRHAHFSSTDDKRYFAGCDGNDEQAKHIDDDMRNKCVKQSALPAVFRDRMRDIATAIPYYGLSQLQYTSSDQINKGQAKKDFCIADTYQIPPISSSHLMDHNFVLPSLSTGNEPYGHMTHEARMAFLNEVHLPAIGNFDAINKK
ncbi:hypothetical protein QZH41_017565, partial [Actinostola sp. cb2023]